MTAGWWVTVVGGLGLTCFWNVVLDRLHERRREILGAHTREELRRRLGFDR